LYQRKTSIVLPKWLTQGSIKCLIKTKLNQPVLTNASVHSLRSLGQLYGRISLHSKAAPANLPSMRGVMCPMIVDKIKYDLVVTSANDFDNLSLECYLDNELLIEADLISYIDKKADIYVRKCPLDMDVIKAFIYELDTELEFAGNPRN
jgi:hypothetical protein